MGMLTRARQALEAWLNGLRPVTFWTMSAVLGTAWFGLCLWVVLGALERGGEAAVWVLFFTMISCAMAIHTLMRGTGR